ASCFTLGCMSHLQYVHVQTGAPGLLRTRQRLFEPETFVLGWKWLVVQRAEDAAPMPCLETLLAPDTHAEQPVQARNRDAAQGRALEGYAQEGAVALDKQQVAARLGNLGERVILNVDAAQRLDALGERQPLQPGQPRPHAPLGERGEDGTQRSRAHLLAN